MKAKDITGMKFGRLTAISYSHKTEKGKRVWLCKCDCGNTSMVRQANLTYGHTKSCGCYFKEYKRVGNRNLITHGMSQTRLYRKWRYMKQKCSNKNVCEEWLRFEPFKEWALANGYEDNLYISLINPYGNFEPSNCRWGKKKRSGGLLSYKGEAHTLREWSNIKNIPYITLLTRLKKGLDVDSILFVGKLPRGKGVRDEKTT